MIKDAEPLSAAEIVEYIEKGGDSGANVKKFVKKFVKLPQKEAEELRKNLEKLEMMKLRKEHIVKIIDLVPENAEDLNKIFIDINLNEDETKKILETVKKFK